MSFFVVNKKPEKPEFFPLGDFGPDLETLISAWCKKSCIKFQTKESFILDLMSIIEKLEGWSRPRPGPFRLKTGQKTQDWSSFGLNSSGPALNFWGQPWTIHRHYHEFWNDLFFFTNTPEHFSWKNRSAALTLAASLT